MASERDAALAQLTHVDSKLAAAAARQRAAEEAEVSHYWLAELVKA